MMKNIKVKWKKVSPADISSTCCAQFFAFSKGNKVFLINEVNNECLFTRIIMTSASLSYSIYDIDIWVGYVTEGMDNFDANLKPHDLLEVLEWSAKLQLQDTYFNSNEITASIA